GPGARRRLRIRVVEVARGQDAADAAQGARLLDVDRANARVGVRAAQDLRVEHARQLQVADVARAAGHLVRALAALQALADRIGLAVHVAGREAVGHRRPPVAPPWATS